MEFDGRRVLVTGGGSGIGREIAKTFADAGAHVAVTGRRAAPLETVAKELEPNGCAVVGDVSKPGAAARIVADTVAGLGGLDVLVNNAGHYPIAPLADHSDDDLWDTFSTNVIGPMALIREATPALREGPGVVINVGSTVARFTKADMAAYSASKFGLEQATRSLACELGPLGIRVNCVAPGMTSTEMIDHLRANEEVWNRYVAATPLGRVGEPDDIADTILAVASDRMRWVTGQVIQCSGGFQL